VANLFKLCHSIERKKVKDGNRVKAELRSYKAKKAEQSGTPAPPGPEDTDSQITDYSFPMANWRFDDDDDDASSMSPVV